MRPPAAAAMGGGVTASDLQQLLLADLVRRHGGTRQRWRRVMGELRVYPPETHPHCNWDVRPSGPAADVDAVNDAADGWRDRHAQVRPG